MLQVKTGHPRWKQVISGEDRFLWMTTGGRWNWASGDAGSCQVKTAGGSGGLCYDLQSNTCWTCGILSFFISYFYINLFHFQHCILTHVHLHVHHAFYMTFHSFPILHINTCLPCLLHGFYLQFTHSYLEDNACFLLYIWYHCWHWVVFPPEKPIYRNVLWFLKGFSHGNTKGVSEKKIWGTHYVFLSRFP